MDRITLATWLRSRLMDLEDAVAEDDADVLSLSVTLADEVMQRGGRFTAPAEDFAGWWLDMDGLKVRHMTFPMVCRAWCERADPSPGMLAMMACTTPVTLGRG